MRSRDVRFLESVFPASCQPVPDISFLNVQWEKSATLFGEQSETPSEDDTDGEVLLQRSVEELPKASCATSWEPACTTHAWVALQRSKGYCDSDNASSRNIPN